MIRWRVYRSRYVAMELKHQYGGATRDGLFAAMPPLEGMRLLLSYVASRQNRKFPHKLMFIDISKAYLHADVLNDSIYVELPGEMNMPNMCGRLLRALYGTRQAVRAWEEEHTKTLKGADFQRGKCNQSSGQTFMTFKAMTILNRIVEWTNARIQYEADSRHVHLIIEELGLENANGSDVTGSKVDINETDTELDHEDAYRFRSIRGQAQLPCSRQN